MADCVGKVFGQVEKRHAEALDEVRQELAALKRELAEVRAEAKVRGAIDDVQARLDKIEQTARPALRTIGKAVTA